MQVLGGGHPAGQQPPIAASYDMRRKAIPKEPDAELTAPMFRVKEALEAQEPARSIRQSTLITL